VCVCVCVCVCVFRGASVFRAICSNKEAIHTCLSPCNFIIYGRCFKTCLIVVASQYRPLQLVFKSLKICCTLSENIVIQNIEITMNELETNLTTVKENMIQNETCLNTTEESSDSVSASFQRSEAKICHRCVH
jgi:hypothetical protein